MTWAEDEANKKKRKQVGAAPRSQNRSDEANDDDDDEESDDDDGSSGWEDVEDSDEQGSDDDGWVDVDRDAEDSDGDDAENSDEEGEDEFEECEEDDEDDEDDDEEDEEDEDEEGEDEEGEEGEDEDTKEVANSLPTSNIRRRLEARRLLTSEDFALIAKLKEAQTQRNLDPKIRKRMLDSTNFDEGAGEDDGENTSKQVLPEFAMDPEALGPGMKTSKTTKIERITKILEGRKDEKFDLGGHAGGLTNKEKLRKKNFMMVRKGKRSVTAKVRKSNSDKRYEKMVHVSNCRIVSLNICLLIGAFFVTERANGQRTKKAKKNIRQQYCFCGLNALYYLINLHNFRQNDF